MRHVTLTCKNHPNLRWSCKEIAFTEGYGYNGMRNIFFNGDLNGETGELTERFTWSMECACPASDLVRAPEDLENFPGPLEIA